MNRFANIYELLGDENDETPRQVGQAAPKKEEPAKKAAAPGGAKPAKGAQANEQKGRAPQQQRDRKPREFSAPVGDQEVERKRESRPPREQRDRDPERRQRSAEALPPRGNQRVFDRRSGTGRGREGKRSGGGRGNWGTVDDDKKAQTEKAEVTEEATGEAKPTTEQPQATQEAPAEVQEEEDNTRTLSEYLTQLKKPVFSLPEARKVEADNKQWSKFKPLSREFEENTFFKEEDEKKDVSESKDESKESKKGVRADDLIKFTEGSPKPFSGRGKRGGGRGGRGGDRGGRGGDRGGRGGSRGGRTGGAAPNLRDESAFPSLSPAPTK